MIYVVEAGGMTRCFSKFCCRSFFLVVLKAGGGGGGEIQCDERYCELIYSVKTALFAKSRAC